MNNLIDRINKLELLKCLSGEQLERLLQTVEIKNLVIGEILNPNKDNNASIYHIEEGMVKTIKHLHDDDKTIISVLGPGEYICELALIDYFGEFDEIRPVSSNVELLQINASAIKNEMSRNPDLIRQIHQLIGGRIIEIKRKFELIHSGRSVYQRVIDVLFELATRHGKRIGDEIFLETGALSQKDIAMMVYATRQTTSASLVKMRDNGLIDYSRETIIIRNPAEMRMLSRFD